MQKDSKIVAVDLFCGVGGLTHGLRQAGIDVVAGVDVDPQCQSGFERNNPGASFLLEDIASLSGDRIKNLWGGATFRLLAGCAPCQPFSTYSQGRNLRTDSRWRLLDSFSRLVGETKPDFVTMENVPSLRKRKVFRDFLKALNQLGYSTWYDVVNCADFGLPQNRYRLVLTASLLGEAPSLKKKDITQRKAVSRAFAGLPSLRAGEEDPDDSLHRCASLSELNLKRIKASSPGGTWRDWPVSLRAECHKRKTGDGYMAVYGRMAPRGQAPTITTQCYNYGSGRFGHPKEDRPISLREAAILQGFPRDYTFEPKGQRLTKHDVAKLIGNAVPPPLGRAIAKTLNRAVRQWISKPH